MSGNYCTQFGQSDLVFGMALIESLYEHVQDESEFVVLGRDEETHDFVKEVRMPQLRVVTMSDVGGGGAESEPLKKERKIKRGRIPSSCVEPPQQKYRI